MEIVEIYADEAGETHFRKKQVAFELKDFAPPSAPLRVSAETPTTTALFLAAPPGWDQSFHATPRRQFAILLSGRATVTVSDGTVMPLEPGNLALLNDQNSKGHLTEVQGSEDCVFVLIGTDGDDDATI